jgi:hypothetical protein
METTAHGEHYVRDGEAVCDRNVCTEQELRRANGKRLVRFAAAAGMFAVEHEEF